MDSGAAATGVDILLLPTLRLLQLPSWLLPSHARLLRSPQSPLPVASSHAAPAARGDAAAAAAAAAALAVGAGAGADVAVVAIDLYRSI